MDVFDKNRTADGLDMYFICFVPLFGFLEGFHRLFFRFLETSARRKGKRDFANDYYTHTKQFRALTKRAESGMITPKGASNS